MGVSQVLAPDPGRQARQVFYRLRTVRARTSPERMPLRTRRRGTCKLRARIARSDRSISSSSTSLPGVFISLSLLLRVRRQTNKQRRI